MTSQLIILGGGASVIEGISKGLFDKLQSKLTFGLNYSHYFVNITATVYTDEVFHAKELGYLEKLPLIISRKFNSLKYPKNSVEFVNSQIYQRDCKNGVYMSNLTGIFALSLAIQILGEGEIFLLGYDYGSEKREGSKKIPKLDHNGTAITHWYQHGNLNSVYTCQPFEIIHRGTGKVNWYEATGIDKDTKERVHRSNLEYKPFKNEKKAKIYNVSETSMIDTFEKISYDKFFEKLSNESLDQDDLRAYILLKTKDIKQQL